ncbi:MAG: lipooligosaccharide transport system permease protein [Actinomycetota bacterium]
MNATHVLPSGPVRVLERNVLAYRRFWLIFAVGFAEPVFYLLSIGIGVGDLVGKVGGPGGQLVTYRDFVAPGLMATAAMNGAVFDTTIMFFIKMKYWRVFDSMLATPLEPSDIVQGEVAWAVVRGVIYAAFFLVTMAVMGLVHSWMGVLLLPSAALVCWAFAGAGAGGASYMRSYFDFDFVNLAIIPSFLFSGVFFDLDRYPTWLATIVRCTPLYQGVALMRGLAFGRAGPVALAHALYLFAMGAVGVRIATRRMTRVLTP